MKKRTLMWKWKMFINDLHWTFLNFSNSVKKLISIFDPCFPDQRVRQGRWKTGQQYHFQASLEGEWQTIKFLCLSFLIQLALGSFFWNRYIQFYANLFEDANQRGEQEKVGNGCWAISVLFFIFRTIQVLFRVSSLVSRWLKWLDEQCSLNLVAELDNWILLSYSSTAWLNLMRNRWTPSSCYPSSLWYLWWWIGPVPDESSATIQGCVRWESSMRAFDESVLLLSSSCSESNQTVTREFTESFFVSPCWAMIAKRFQSKSISTFQ